MRLMRRLMPLLLAVSLALPVATLAEPAPARAACYWSNTKTSYVVAYPAAYTTFMGQVSYQIGYDCSGYAREILVGSIYNTLRFTNSHAYHQSNEVAVLKWFNPSTWQHSLAWADGRDIGCTGNCTIVRSVNPRLIIPYDSRAAVHEWYGHCDWAGYGWCRVAHQFVVSRVYTQWGG